MHEVGLSLNEWQALVDSVLRVVVYDMRKGGHQLELLCKSIIISLLKLRPFKTKLIRMYDNFWSLYFFNQIKELINIELLDNILINRPPTLYQEQLIKVIKTLSPLKMNPYEYNPQIYGQQNSAPQNMIFTVAVNQGFTNNPNNNIYPPLFNPETQYIIQSGVGHNMVLDISQADQNYGQLIIWKKHGKRNQRFKIVQQYNGKYLLVSCSGMSLLSVSNNSHHEGSTIYTHYGNGTEGQIWEFEQVKQKPEWFYIKNGHHKYLDVFEEKSKKGTKVIQWKFHGKKNQIWRIVAVN